ncbi:MAG: peptidoglycan DD-metalloendopeptidase family protein [Flavobacteriales bacterium]
MRSVLLTVLCSLPFAPLHAQFTIVNDGADHGHGSYHPAATECITAAERAYIQEQIVANRALLQAQGLLPENGFAPTPLFNWPLRPANGLTDPGYHGISNYVDLNASYPNVLLDWNCGTRSYDVSNGYNHMGTDFFTWPWSWYKMDFNQVEIVAASSGTIIFKQDGNYDRSCSTSGGNWNAVYVQHNDGSVAWYGHMKTGSLTTKAVGQTVAQGEYLGVVGSSGNSTGPHLHFEVYNSSNQRIEPWAGPCNSTVTSSWWASQRPYYDPAVNAMRTQSAPTNFGTCPAQEVINERQNFCPSTTVYFTAYYRDQLNGQTSTTTIRRPDNSVFATYNTTATQYYAASWWWNSYTLPSNAPTGLWTYDVTLNGVTTRRYFSVGTTTPVIAANGSTAICAGDSVRLTVPRMPGHSYAWRLNGNPITNATDTVYWAKLAGGYTCAATSTCSSATSTATTVTVNPGPATPVITRSGLWLSIPPQAGSTYLWFLNGSPLGGQTGTSTFAAVDGAYTARVIAGNGCASLSAPSTVTALTLPLKVLLEGPYNTGTGLMEDALRTQPSFPLAEPYAGLGYVHAGGSGGESITAPVLAATGANAIVDWLLVELRSTTSPHAVLASRAALLQRDGDVVDLDGTGSLRFGAAAGSFRVAVRHRNHLGAMTGNAIALSTTTPLVDFTSPALALYGTGATRTVGSVQVLWAGDVNFNGAVQYTGAGNDRDPILLNVGSTTPNNTASGYTGSDVNLNGSTQYTGAGNDRDPLLLNVGSTTPNNVRTQQLP